MRGSGEVEKEEWTLADHLEPEAGRDRRQRAVKGRGLG